MKTFKESHEFFKRAKESDRMHKKYPTRICVIVEKARNAPKDTPDIDRKKYLVPRDISISQFMYVIRNRIHMPTEKVYFYLSITITCHQQVLRLVPFTKNIKTQMDSYISRTPLKAPLDNDISKLY